MPPAVVIPSKPIELFISYVNEDRDISKAVYNALTDAFGNDLQVFFDTVAIQQGSDLKESIASRLQTADVLVVISTGHERPAHDWAGYELGFFAASHLKPLGERTLWGKIVSLCSADAPPKPEADRLYIKLNTDEASIFASVDDFKANLVIKPDDQFLRFFGDIYMAINGIELNTKQKDCQRIADTVKELRVKIFSQFKTRPRLIERPQGRIIASWKQDIAAHQRGRLPEDTIIKLMGGASRVFGLPADIENKDLRWSDFVRQLNATPTSKLQIHTLGSCLLLASEAGAVNRTSDGMLPTANYQQLFRLVLNTSTTYYDERIEANVGLVEVIRRADLGNEETSTLLKGLDIVCRFRALFLERDSEFNFVNFNTAVDATKLVDLARRLGAELDLIVCDCVEAKLDQPARWTRFVDPKDIQEMGSVWTPINQRLLDLCDEILSSSDESELCALGDKTSQVLQEVVRKASRHNEALLTAMAQKLVNLSLTPTAMVPPPQPEGSKT